VTAKRLSPMTAFCNRVNRIELLQCEWGAKDRMLPSLLIRLMYCCVAVLGSPLRTWAEKLIST
jgi:hypothetical protein